MYHHVTLLVQGPFSLAKEGTYLLNLRGHGRVDAHGSGIGLKKQKGNDQAW